MRGMRAWRIVSHDGGGGMIRNWRRISRDRNRRRGGEGKGSGEGGMIRKWSIMIHDDEDGGNEKMKDNRH